MARSFGATSLREEPGEVDPARKGEPGAGGNGPLIAVLVLLALVIGVGALLLFTGADSDAPTEVCMKVSYESTNGMVPATLCYTPKAG